MFNVSDVNFKASVKRRNVTDGEITTLDDCRNNSLESKTALSLLKYDISELDVTTEAFKVLPKSREGDVDMARSLEDGLRSEGCRVLS